MNRLFKWLAIIINIAAFLIILASGAAPRDQAQTVILAMIGLSLASYHLARLTA